MINTLNLKHGSNHLTSLSGQRRAALISKLKHFHDQNDWLYVFNHC
jgi:hypothetical protein